MVPVKAAAEVVSRLEELDARRLMSDQLMRRILFRMVVDGGSWLRVRTGDVDPDGQTRCRLTYKMVEQVDHLTSDRQIEVERAIDLVVESYDECVELLSRIGLMPVSRQETRRTKYICQFEDARYTVSFDTWPWLEDLRFVSVEPLEGISPDSLEDFGDSLGLRKYRGYKGGVDQAYRERLGFEVSSIRDVRFGVLFPGESILVADNSR